MCIYYRIFIFLVINLLSNVYFSIQAQENLDAGSWNTISLEHEFAPDFSVILEEELRIKENYSRLNLFYTNVGVLIKPIKSLKVGLTYRNTQKYRKDNTFSSRNRLMLDITLKQKSGNMIFLFRQRLQGEVRNIYTSENGKLPEYFSRSKFEIKYDFGKNIIPYFSSEFRFQIHDPRNPQSDGLWHRVRNIIGIDYKVNYKNTIGIYYLIQSEWDVVEPEDLYILGLLYAVNI